MAYHIIAAAARTVSAWAGGTTEQLFIWPPEAEYPRRDFALRVSTATVALAESDFTALPGFTRWIMPLSGAMSLTHAGHGGAALGPMDVHRFEGGWKTHSAGQCIDFNLMLAAGWGGAISAKAGVYRCEVGGFVGVYAFGGPAEVVVEGARVRLENRDVLVLHGPGTTVIEATPVAVFAAWPL